MLKEAGLGDGQVVQARRGAEVGSRMDFMADFLGRKLAYTYEIAELEPNDRVVMRTAEGPFPIETTHAWRQGATAEPG